MEPVTAYLNHSQDPHRSAIPEQLTKNLLLSARWPQTVIADYPALARPGSPQVQVPDFWQPEV